MIRACLILFALLISPLSTWAEENTPNLPRPKYLFINSSTTTMGKDAYAGLSATLYSPRSFKEFQPFIQVSYATSGGLYYSDGVKNAYLQKDIRYGAGVRTNSRFGVHSLSVGLVQFEGKTILPDDFNALKGKKSGLYLTSDNWFNVRENVYLAVYANFTSGLNRKTVSISPTYHFKYFTKYQPLVGVEYSYSSDIGGKMQRYGFHFTPPATRFGLSKFSFGLGSDGKSRPKPYTNINVWRSF